MWMDCRQFGVVCLLIVLSISPGSAKDEWSFVAPTNADSVWSTLCSVEIPINGNRRSSFNRVVGNMLARGRWQEVPRIDILLPTNDSYSATGNWNAEDIPMGQLLMEMASIYSCVVVFRGNHAVIGDKSYGTGYVPITVVVDWRCLSSQEEAVTFVCMAGTRKEVLCVKLDVGSAGACRMDMLAPGSGESISSWPDAFGACPRINHPDEESTRFLSILAFAPGFSPVSTDVMLVRTSTWYQVRLPDFARK